ncbi:MAG: PhnD/SsuA/transferrin family substrate-binding protein, partial [Planctomycetota bacterium]
MGRCGNLRRGSSSSRMARSVGGHLGGAALKQSTEAPPSNLEQQEAPSRGGAEVAILDHVFPETPLMQSAGARAVLIAVWAVFCCVFTSSAEARERVTFVGVALDKETRQADRRLQDYLQRKADIAFAPEELEYGQVIKRLVAWDPANGVVLARTTPYVQVASELLGAELEILATYESMATRSTTYHSYYVVRKDTVPPNPTPADVISFISEAPKRVRFTYHNLFSTSSFFLPSLHFRANGVFHMPEPTESLAAIEVKQADVNSSSHLVRAVARGEADLAAVWDGTRARFVDDPAEQDADVTRAVAFVQLPSSIPNDLLVCSRSASAELKESVRSAIRAMRAKEIEVGDFSHWVDIRDATDARAALAELRWLAREQVAPVTVDVRRGTGSPSGTEIMADAARHAVRLSGTELVLFDEDFHEHLDTVWTLDEIHDGASQLTASIPGTGIAKQVFPISFRDPQDLTGRIVAIAQAKLHRIRYVWPYSGDQPIVIRDTTLPMDRGWKVPVQRITWLNPKRNSFRAGPVFDVTVRASSLFVHELEARDFRPSDGTAVEFDPMSNVSYR